MQNLKIDGDRLWNSLMEMAQIGATKKGGVRRLTLTDLDRESRELFTQWCEDAGCTVTVDKVVIRRKNPSCRAVIWTASPPAANTMVPMACWQR
jgi:acetylornithine deacetylase/succinyl-diaminopimelate desuccinylase-like protein